MKFGFDMKVLGIKRNLKKDEDKFKDIIDDIGTLENLKQFCSQADFIVNCLPTIPNVKNIYTKEVFNAMKNQAVFVNVARGIAVDEQALIQALLNNKLAGAALEVFFEEKFFFKLLKYYS